MRLPRNLSGGDLVKVLRQVGYETTRQTGSHIRITTTVRGQHHITVPNHNPVKVGTLSGILSDVAAHLQIEKEELANQLFGK